MNKKINQVDISFPTDRSRMIEAAIAMDETCVSVGGLAHKYDMVEVENEESSSMGLETLGLLVNRWRRKNGMTKSEFAIQSGMSIEEVMMVEKGSQDIEPRIIYLISATMNVSSRQLQRLAGHIVTRDQALSSAAVRFAANSESLEKLSKDEEDALNEFIKVISE